MLAVEGRVAGGVLIVELSRSGTTVVVWYSCPGLVQLLVTGAIVGVW